MATIAAPISIPAAISDLKVQIANIRKKNTVLIGYYIDPKPVPSELLAHDPRLGILNSRLDTLAKLSYPSNGKTGNLSYIIDEPDAIAAEYLNEIIDQLLNAIHGFQEIFEQRYDTSLKQKKPFGTIYQTIEYRETQLKTVIYEARHPPPGMLEPLRPEDMNPSEPVYFCRGAVQMINGRDKGRISSVFQADLSRENRSVLSKFGGVYLWWQCPSCDFRVRFHIAGSSSSTIHNTDEIREHPGCDVEYRSIILAKFHLFNDPGFNDQDVSVIDRRPRIWGSRSSSSSNTRFMRGPARYGCVFCFAQGKELSWEEDTVFRTGQDLAEHIAENHRKSKKIPPPLMLRQFCVAIDGRLSDGVRRWELNFK